MTEEEREAERLQSEADAQHRKARVFRCPYCYTYYDLDKMVLICEQKLCRRLHYLDRKFPLGIKFKTCLCKSKIIELDKTVIAKRAVIYCEKCKPTEVKYIRRD